MYKSVILGYAPKAKDCGRAVEEEANKQEKEGFTLVSFAISPSAKPVLIFYKDETKKEVKETPVAKPVSKKPTPKKVIEKPATPAASEAKPVSENKPVVTPTK